MKFIANLISSLIMASLLGAIAIFSIQNIQLISLQFFSFRSIQLPIGVLLTFCLGVGIVLGSLVSASFSPRKRSRAR
ncbi:MAG: LapA family protein [Xenococcaceae cyanobacterium MO_188.B32]|nr:LapA family protein [Xenococcaceae cyanobacterium MO_188.B32]